jgi:hypothetical protein
MTSGQDAWKVHGKPRPSWVTFAPEMKLTEQQMIQRDLDDIEKEMADARRILKEAEEPDTIWVQWAQKSHPTRDG